MKSGKAFHMKIRLSGLCAVAGIGLAATLSSCGTDAHRIDPNGVEGLTTVYDINAKDWQMAAESCINSMMKSGKLDRTDGRMTILAITGILNKTAVHVDTAILTNMIREAVLKSGKAMTTTAWTGTGGAEDPATRNVRNLQNDPLFDHRTVQPQGTAIAPDMTIAGEIIQIMATQGRYNESTVYFHITLTDLRTGLAVWEGQSQVAKQEKKNIFGY
jgi:penicillin-binding protein activator